MSDKNVALDFLLYNYISLTIEDCKDWELVVGKSVERAYIDATNQGVYNALFTKDKRVEWEISNNLHKMLESDNPTEILKKAVIKLFGDEYIGGVSIKEKFDEWHKLICMDLVNIYKKNLQSNMFSFGNAQKWVNMTIKYKLISGILTPDDCFICKAEE